MTDASFSPLLRLTPKKAPFRRGGVSFPTLAAVTLRPEALDTDDLLALAEEPLVDLDESRDGGETWRRYDLPWPPEDRRPQVADPALSPERAIDPTGTIVPRDRVPTDAGLVAPPEAADPAVPLAGGQHRVVQPGEGRPVATGGALDGETAASVDAQQTSASGEAQAAGAAAPGTSRRGKA